MWVFLFCCGLCLSLNRGCFCCFCCFCCVFSVNRNDVQAIDSLLGSNSTQHTNGTCAKEFFKFEFSTWCWGFWVILVLFLLLCCLCCLFCFWRQTRPRVFVRLYQSGKHGNAFEAAWWRGDPRRPVRSLFLYAELTSCPLSSFVYFGNKH